MKPLYSFYTSTAIAVVILLAGCAAGYTHGNKLDQNSVSQIKKGVTTRAEVIAALGPPTNVGLMGDGRRMMFYSYSDASAKPTAISFIPIVGLFAGGATGQRTTQSLQIILDKNDIVEDYELSSQETAIGSSGGSMGMPSMTSTPVTPQNK